VKIYSKATVQQKLTGVKSVNLKGFPFAVNSWYFIFRYKGNLLFKSLKTSFSGLSQNMEPIHFTGVRIANN
jgi:hypothetical protein